MDSRSGSSLSNRISEMILKSCRAKDSGACISSILRDNDGRTVVRVRAGSTNSNAVQMLKALHGLWPLATTAVVENQLDGTVEAQVVVPRPLLADFSGFACSFLELVSSSSARSSSSAATLARSSQIYALLLRCIGVRSHATVWLKVAVLFAVRQHFN